MLDALRAGGTLARSDRTFGAGALRDFVLLALSPLDVVCSAALPPSYSQTLLLEYVFSSGQLEWVSSPSPSCQTRC